jgi:hypothetical protein
MRLPGVRSDPRGLHNYNYLVPVPVPVPEEPVPVPMPPEPVLPAPVLPVLGIEPEEEPGALGEVVVVPEDVPPVAPAPALEPCCLRQSSRCVPMRPTHWLGLVEAPVAADPAAEPLVLVSLGLVDVEPLVLAPAPAEPEPTLEPALPPAAASVDGVVDDAPVEPDAPVPVASVAVDSARSAAAVAAVMVFNIMR